MHRYNRVNMQIVMSLIVGYKCPVIEYVRGYVREW